MVKRWDYGDAGDRIPVRSGDVWRVGDHLLACGNVERSDHSRLMHYLRYLEARADGKGRIRMVYVDPPWNQGNINAFFTKAGLRRDGLSYESFLAALLLPLTEIPHIYMEGGLRERSKVEGVVRQLGLHILDVWNIVYYRKHPCLLYHISAEAGRVLPGAPVDGADDTETPGFAIARSACLEEWVFDPCIGRGLTALTAQELGCRCLGMELNPRRLAVTIDKLNKKYELPYKQIGRLEDLA